MIVGQSNYCPACGSSDSSLGVNPFLDKKIITDGRKNHLCQTFREMLEKEKEVRLVNHQKYHLPKTASYLKVA